MCRSHEVALFRDGPSMSARMEDAVCARNESATEWHFPCSGLQSLTASSLVIFTRHESRQMHQSRLSRSTCSSAKLPWIRRCL